MAGAVALAVAGAVKDAGATAVDAEAPAGDAATDAVAAVETAIAVDAEALAVDAATDEIVGRKPWPLVAVKASLANTVTARRDDMAEMAAVKTRAPSTVAAAVLAADAEMVAMMVAGATVADVEARAVVAATGAASKADAVASSALKAVADSAKVSSPDAVETAGVRMATNRARVAHAAEPLRLRHQSARKFRASSRSFSVAEAAAPRARADRPAPTVKGFLRIRRRRRNQVA